MSNVLQRTTAMATRAATAATVACRLAALGFTQAVKALYDEQLAGGVDDDEALAGFYAGNRFSTSGDRLYVEGPAGGLRTWIEKDRCWEPVLHTEAVRQPVATAIPRAWEAFVRALELVVHHSSIETLGTRLLDLNSAARLLTAADIVTMLSLPACRGGTCLVLYRLGLQLLDTPTVDISTRLEATRSHLVWYRRDVLGL